MKYTGTIAGEFSGSLGAITASRNRGGLYFKQRTTPVNPNSTKQAQVRGVINNLSSLWIDTMSAVEREAWDAYAIAIPGFNGTGLDQFIRSNLTRRYANLVLGSTNDVIYTAPTVIGTGAFTPPTMSITAPNAVSVTFDNTDEWANETGSFLYIFLGGGQNQSAKSNRLHQALMSQIPGDDTTAPTSPFNFNTTIPVSQLQRVFFRVAASRADGRYSYPYVGNLLAA